MCECGCENGGKWSAERKEDVEEVDVEYKMGGGGELLQPHVNNALLPTDFCLFILSFRQQY